MKLSMKLRTRLFLSISALITVALLGLLVGLLSVTQMARSQSELIQRGFSAVQLGQQLRRRHIQAAIHLHQQRIIHLGWLGCPEEPVLCKPS